MYLHHNYIVDQIKNKPHIFYYWMTWSIMHDFYVTIKPNGIIIDNYELVLNHYYQTTIR
jgi:hypothetical protein